MKVLVAYATAHGSTAEIATRIAETLNTRGISASAAAAETIQSVQGYDAFVLGSPIHSGMWLTELAQFISNFQEDLTEKPTYMFITCIRLLEADGEQHVQENYINRQVTDKIGVSDVKAFAGRLAMEAVGWDERWALAARYDGAKVPGSYNSDFRDWNAIRDWALEIAEDLNKG